jgi:serine/threonine-protein kinase HipA
MLDYTPTDSLYLWWLANPAQPRLVGRLRLLRRSGQHPGGVSLEYAPEWLSQGLALSEDLPLQEDRFLPSTPDSAAGAVEDARPDRWGERVIRLLDRPARLSLLEYLYFAGDDRFGALGVSPSATHYLPRHHGPLPILADAQALHDLVRQLEAGETVDEVLRRLVTPGATLGGARPKALLQMESSAWVIKFSEAGEVLDSPLIEHACMRLAARAGIEVCDTRALPLQRGHALAVRRFDRHVEGAGEQIGERRLHAQSAYVALRAAGQEMGYPELALLLRRRAPADEFAAQGEQLFRRLVFNILIDNTDDHEKNHVLLMTPTQHWRLSPAFDVLPSGHALGYQQMRVGRQGAESTLVNAMSEHRAFALTSARAQQVATEVAQVVSQWQEAFAHHGVTAADLALLAQAIDRPHLKAQRDALLETEAPQVIATKGRTRSINRST